LVPAGTSSARAERKIDVEVSEVTAQ